MAGLTKKQLRLPKAVLDMKFMKKTKERLQRERANTENHEDLYAQVITDQMRKSSGNYISESSFIFCEELIEGRLSFKGMNPEIERIMELESIKQEVDGEMLKDVSDEVLVKKLDAFHMRKRPYGSPSDFAAKKKSKKT